MPALIALQLDDLAELNVLHHVAVAAEVCSREDMCMVLRSLWSHSHEGRNIEVVGSKIP